MYSSQCHDQVPQATQHVDARKRAVGRCQAYKRSDMEGKERVAQLSIEL